MFCELDESLPDNAEVWVEKVLSALSDLYTCAHNLLELSIENEPEVGEGIYDVTYRESEKQNKKINFYICFSRFFIHPLWL